MVSGTATGSASTTGWMLGRGSLLSTCGSSDTANGLPERQLAKKMG